MNSALRFIRISTSKAHTSTIVPDDYINQMKHHLDLQQWLDQFEALLLRLNHTKRTAHSNAMNLLRIHHRSICIWLSVCLSNEECALDAFNADFEGIVSFDTNLASNSQPTANYISPEPPSFSFEMQLIPPLYYTAIKCRIPSIRRRAVDLLRLAPRHEGLWSAQVSAKLAEKVTKLRKETYGATLTLFLVYTALLVLCCLRKTLT
jgi:hypothetical protein